MRGIDVSKWQDPKKLHYPAMGDVEFVIARATYGVRPDPSFKEHVELARANGRKVGAYHFFRQNQGLSEQLEAFVAQMDAVGIGEGDIQPTIDLEWNVKHDGPVNSSAHNAAARFFMAALIEKYGGVIFYMAPYFWRDVLKKPTWEEAYGVSLWISHWGVNEPDAAGLEWSIWQDRNDFLAGARVNTDQLRVDGNVLRDGHSLPIIDTKQDEPKTDDPEHGARPEGSVEEVNGKMLDLYECLKKVLNK